LFCFVFCAPRLFYIIGAYKSCVLGYQLYLIKVLYT
jgi:hypothetical protein